MSMYTQTRKPGARHTSTLVKGLTFHEEMAHVLHGLSTTGYVVVVFETERAALEILPEGSTTKLSMDGLEIEVEWQRFEPDTVLWNGFSVSDATRRRNIYSGTAWLILVIIGWAIFCVGPYVLYILAWSGV